MACVLTDVAETTADINIEAARAEREAAEKALAANSTKAVEETEVFRDELDLANARLQLAGR